MQKLVDSAPAAAYTWWREATPLSEPSYKIKAAVGLLFVAGMSTMGGALVCVGFKVSPLLGIFTIGLIAIAAAMVLVRYLEDR